jgi:hypothetical protein
VTYEENPLTFHKKKQRLRSIYKKYKVGMIGWEEIDPEDQALLMKYYGVN